MKTESIRYLENGGLEIIEVDIPDPGPGEVQVKAAACGICMWDISTYKRGANDRYAAPPGHEGVGYVHKLGAGVTEFKEGDRVANGSFAGFANFPVQSLYRIPSSDLPDEYWIVEPPSCIITALDTAKLLAGDRVAVIGCGFMGLMLVQALAHSCIDKLVALDIDDRKLELAKQFGATAAVNPRSEKFEEEAKRLHDLPLDAVFDASGAQQGLTVATQLAKTGGLISLFGWNRGEAKFPGDAWHLGGFTVVNSSPLARIRDTFPPAMRLLQKRIIDLEPLVTDVVPLSEYASLLDEVVKGRDRMYIKGVVKLN